MEPKPVTTRRTAIAATLAMAFSRPTLLIGENNTQLQTRLAEIEHHSQGRLGVALLDTATGRITGFRTTQRFPMCSTFKALAVALVLRRVDQGQEQLTRRVPVAATDLLPYAPTVEKRSAAGFMTVAELCEAAVTLSDNAAANLLLASFGGPPAVTAFLRSVGDTRTRLDRNEPTLNSSIPGDPRDTTTPAAMASTMSRLALADVLTPASRTQLCEWLIACTTGVSKLRAGFPAGTKIGDKTGSGDNGTNNDAAIVWLPGRKPLVIASYLTGSPLAAPDLNGIHAEVGRAIVDSLGIARLR